ncbi:hypothetical protein N5T90_06540 [Aliarcobacter cryaerophilus]|uniref:hypothetical protein n=1 Tax=Aliarcobacter cryaerophilus TaxID=28198 RepID=UPI0021B5E275|nr:hypothetical protein [Aliarcobacter cryaerophilus]MCT7470526.1 hypothetical protein [Aliarcobacter cryaerophilus]
MQTTTTKTNKQRAINKLIEKYKETQKNFSADFRGEFYTGNDEGLKTEEVLKNDGQALKEQLIIDFRGINDNEKISFFYERGKNRVNEYLSWSTSYKI